MSKLPPNHKHPMRLNVNPWVSLDAENVILGVYGPRARISLHLFICLQSANGVH